MEYIPAKTIITRSKHPEYWFGTEYNMNIYKGCCHGCIYCDSRSNCYGVESFDTVRAKENALEIIRDELRRKSKRGVVATGAMSDPYNPFEKELKLTRHALELCNAFEFGIAIATKSALLARDIDVLCDIKEHSPVLCKVTITTCDDSLAKKLEPGVNAPTERFELIRKLSENGIYTGILLMPVLPFIEDTDENILGIIRQAKEAGARFIYPAFGVTLRENQREWYYEKLNQIFPGEGLVEKYQKRFGNMYECRSPRARHLWKIFSEECHRAGLLYNMKDIISSYKRPYKMEQLSLFDL